MKTRIIISIFWLIFAILFFTLAGFHWVESKQIIQEFDITRVLGDGADITIFRPSSGKRASLDKPLQDFVRDFNKYLDGQNESNRRANLLACYGYLLAGLTALVSLVFEWRGIHLSKVQRNQ